MKFKTLTILSSIWVSLSAQMITPCIPCGMPKLSFVNEDTTNIFVQGEFLFWKPYADTLDWGVSFDEFNVPAFQITNVRDNLEILHADFPWRSGVRLSGGFSICSWDNTFRWTYFYSKGNDSRRFLEFSNWGIRQATTDVLHPIWPSGNGPINAGASIEELLTRYSLKMNCIDWEMGKSLYLSQAIFIRPFLGIRSGNLDQIMNVDYNNSVVAGIDVMSSKMRMKNKFWGLGPRIGADAKWHINRYFSIFGMSACSLMGGRFKISENEEYVLSNDLPNPINSRNGFKIHTFKPSLDLGIGIEFFNSFCNELFSTELDIGYEFHYWPEQTQFLRLYSNVRAIKQVGDIATQGLSIRGAIYF